MMMVIICNIISNIQINSLSIEFISKCFFISDVANMINNHTLKELCEEAATMQIIKKHLS